MSWSLGETSALAIKAVRGAGEPWGVAQEAGWAVRWLARAGMPGVSALARAIEANDLSDLRAGIELSDRGKVGSAISISVDALLVLPFLSRCVPAGQAWNIETGNGSFRLWREGSDPIGGVEVLAINGQVPLPDPLPGPVARVGHDEAAFAILNEFAARTYAPATEASRQGAGAGLTDND